MIEHITIDQGGIGLCDACPAPSPPPTPSPTTLLSEQTCKKAGGSYLDDGRRNVDTSKPFYSCFVVKLQPGNSGLDRGDGVDAKVGTHCWTESIQIHGVNVGCYPSGYSEGGFLPAIDFRYWHGTSGTGNGNCGHPCTEFDEHYPFDHTCTVAKGVYQNDGLYDCFQWKDTTKYCWTHTSCPDCDRCTPLGYIHATIGDYSEGWNFAIFSPSQRSDPNSCGPPCTEVVLFE
jgi:hypothetical protein